MSEKKFDCIWTKARRRTLSMNNAPKQTPLFKTNKIGLALLCADKDADRYSWTTEGST